MASLESGAATLPELARVPWRDRTSEATLRRDSRRWTACTAAHTLPHLATAGALAALNPLTVPLGAILLGHAWVVPELYAARGAKVTRVTGRPEAKAARVTGRPGTQAEAVALGLLGDLLDHRARELHARSGLALEPGRFGAWLLGPSGAILVRPGGRIVHCYCVRVTEAQLPPSDRTAHLLLALREDEAGFATLANLVFAGATWRLRRRLAGSARSALEEAVRQARAIQPAGPGDDSR
ncbi:MAG TPA: hypothetical protein VE983_12690 [Solirubrobacteraceae bacterium]|nr:hypothetical protein [Solirubrobacteraceae bacterium]